MVKRKKDKKEEDYGFSTMSAVHGIIDEKSHKFISLSNERTWEVLSPLWIKNMEKNLPLWKKYGGIGKSCWGIGVNKAIIAIGAGQSFNKNKDVLKFIHDHDGVKDWLDRDFIFMACNHQYKPLLKMGIIPDFVVLVDASDVVYNQLCVDVPDIGISTALIAPFHGSPKVINEWIKQGKEISFFSTATKAMLAEVEKIIGEDPLPHSVNSGGNVLNTIWTSSLKIFGSKVFMCVGNDLSFPIKEKKKDQEDSYYADGDYSSNAKGTGTGRDEAACEKKWLGFSLKKRSIVVPGKNSLELVGDEIVGTSHTLWVYKTVVEEGMILITKLHPEYGLHYYNCSEGGILGVMAKSTDDAEMKKEDNWYPLDDVCHRWHTTTLEHAATQYLQAKQRANGGIQRNRLYTGCN
jgi:hypothetical protein